MFCFIKFHVLSASNTTIPTVTEIIMCYVICVLFSRRGFTNL